MVIDLDRIAPGGFRLIEAVDVYGRLTDDPADPLLAEGTAELTFTDGSKSIVHIDRALQVTPV